MDFKVGFKTGMAVDFDTELQGLARRVQAVRPRVQNRSAIAKPGNSDTVEQMRIDACDLRGGIGAQPEAAPRKLIDQLEGLQIKLVAGT